MNGLSYLNRLSFYAQVVIENELWISNSLFNGLFRLDLESGRIRFAGSFPQHNPEDGELHLFAKKYGEKLYFFPKCSKSIDIYDLKTGEFTYVECRANTRNGYVTAIDAFPVDEERIIIIPCYSQMPLQEISLKREAVIRRTDLIKSSRCVQNETGTMSLYACKMGKEIFYPIHGTNKVGSYHLEEKKEKIYSIKGLERILGDIISDGNDLWINADQGIYQWNPYADKLKFICDCLSVKEGWMEQFILYRKKVICIPRWLGSIKIIDRETFGYSEVHIDRPLLNTGREMPWRDVRESFVWRNNLVICPVKYREAIWINLDSYHITYRRWMPLMAMRIKGSYFIHETAEEDLRNYIVIVDKNERTSGKIERNRIGRSILQKA